jgi:hypothetical protein
MDAIQFVVDREDALYRAMIALDYAALGDFLSDDLSYAHSTGVVESKMAYLDGLRGGLYEYGSITRASGNTMLFLGVAFTTGAIDMCVGTKGAAKSVIRLQHVLIWREEAAVWHLLLRQATRIPT